MKRVAVPADSWGLGGGVEVADQGSIPFLIRQALRCAETVLIKEQTPNTLVWNKPKKEKDPGTAQCDGALLCCAASRRSTEMY